MEQQYITVKDIQKILHISRNSAYKLIKRPDFPKTQIGHSIRIPIKKFEEFMTEYSNEKITL